ncbi:MAG: hypothetical protein ACLFS2_00155 [Halochromatium sp.]|uniref:hypothetical protein n=1 Tax=Halochromatium sp. TaxID=2049430 RepID=UPI00397852EE
MAPTRRPRTRAPLSDWPRRAIDWLCAGRSDYRSFQERKRTRVYRRNRASCLYAWAVAAALLLVCGGVSCLVAIGLVTTLICFLLLDPE